MFFPLFVMINFKHRVEQVNSETSKNGNTHCVASNARNKQMFENQQEKSRILQQNFWMAEKFV